MTTFSVRNAYYLRVSASSVIPLYLYLDERHIDWMSDRILQHVLADLRPLVLPKLQTERDIHFGPGASSGKKGAVDVHRGESYQFAFFFQKTEPHSVIIKTRSFAPAPRPPSPPKVNVHQTQPGTSNGRGSKRKGRASKNQPAHARSSGRKRQKTKGRSWARNNEELITSLSDDDDEDEEDDQDVISLSDDNSDTNEMEETRNATRRSQRTRRVPIGGYREDDEDHVYTPVDKPSDVEMDTPTEPPRNEIPTGVSGRPDLPMTGDSDINPTIVKEEDTEMSFGTVVETALDAEIVVVTSDQPPIEFDDEDTKKQKLALRLKYQGFNIFGRCLCVVVEPWPSIRSVTRAPSVMPLTNEVLRGSSVVPPDFVRDRTPLFLPDLDRGRSQTPVPFPPARTLPPVPLFNDLDLTSESDDEVHGSDDLMVFSRALNAAGGMHIAAADDDDEMDGAVLFGDADEVREFS